MQTLDINSFSTQLKDIVKKAYPKAGMVTFRLFVSPTPIDAADSEGRRFTMDRLPARKRLKLKERIIDPGTNRPVTIANLTGYEEGAAVGQAQRPIIGEIEFLGANNGQIDVDPTRDPVLFERLLLSDYNANNPNPSAKEPDTGYLFGIVQPAKDAQKKFNSALDVARVLVAIDDLDDEATVRAVEKLSLPTVDRGRTLETDELKMSLVVVAQADAARVEGVLEAGENKLEELVKKAVELGILDFVEDAQQWRWKSNQQLITEAVHGYKPEQALVLYIQNNPNGTRFSQTLASAVKGKEKKTGNKPKEDDKTPA
jgi:hypothetical protein